jgi:hypothetical protein
MREIINNRVKALKEEFARGEERLAALDRERTKLSEVLLRISGAIQVLEETLAETPEEPAPK